MLRTTTIRLKLALTMLLLTGWPLLAAQEEAGQRKPPTFTEFLFQPKFIVMFTIAVVVLILLKSRWMSKGLKVAFLLLATLLFGVIGNVGIPLFSSFSMHPSPMCAVGKPFLFGLRVPFMAMLTAMVLLTLIGPKLFCGWICPVGAVQELIAMAADKMKLVRKKNQLFNILWISLSPLPGICHHRSRRSGYYDHKRPDHSL